MDFFSEHMLEIIFGLISAGAGAAGGDRRNGAGDLCDLASDLLAGCQSCIKKSAHIFKHCLICGLLFNNAVFLAVVLVCIDSKVSKRMLIAFA